MKDNIFTVGAVDWDRRLFDELIPLPDGTSYNSYLLKGCEKTALIDTVDPTKKDDLISNLKELGIDRIDYVISNHAEQDHSGCIPVILGMYQEAKVVTNQKCKDMLIDLLLIPEERFITVDDGDTLSLGDKTLEFILAPWVHWPETMLTYLREDRILFPCDLFGSHLATSDMYVKDECNVYRSAKRYYAEIMMPFRINIKKHMMRLSNYKIDIIAPSHGPIYQKPAFIMKAYEDWISDNVKNEVVLPYVSMHGSTKKMVDHLISALTKKGVTVKPFNLVETDIGELAMSLVDCATVVVGSPTVLTGPHPEVLHAVYLLNVLRPKVRYVSVIGSYGWGTRVLDMIKSNIVNLKVELIEPVIVKGYPKENDFRLLDRLSDEIAKRHARI
ncbi:MAG: FprA family A-type flavoprotein [Candidatus Thermoplasmatota archaeon]